MVPSGSIVTWSAWGGFPGNFDFSGLNFQVPAQAPAGVSCALRWNGIASNKTGMAKSENAAFFTLGFILVSTPYHLLLVVNNHLMEWLPCLVGYREMKCLPGAILRQNSPTLRFVAVEIPDPVLSDDRSLCARSPSNSPAAYRDLAPCLGFVRPTRFLALPVCLKHCDRPVRQDCQLIILRGRPPWEAGLSQVQLPGACPRTRGDVLGDHCQLSSNDQNGCCKASDLFSRLAQHSSPLLL